MAKLSEVIKNAPDADVLTGNELFMVVQNSVLKKLTAASLQTGVLKGDKGDKGDQGYQGIQGVAGIAGSSVGGDISYSTLISITDTVTMDDTHLSKAYLVTGTTADYSIYLPAVAVSSGKQIAFIMGSTTTLTKLITLDGNSTETIDGTTTRIMWSNETCILYCDGSMWRKIAGKSIPMQAGIYQSANQYFATDATFAANTKLNLDTAKGTPSVASLLDTANKQIIIRRNSYYTGLFNARITANNASATVMLFYPTPFSSQLWYYAVASKFNGVCLAMPVASINAGTAVSISVSYETGNFVTTTFTAAAHLTYLTIMEIPQW
jgi:hypothetical protein